MHATSTSIITGVGKSKELKSYDEFQKKIVEIADYFRKEIDYPGYPFLPNSKDLSWLQPFEIYDNADDEEKVFIAHRSIDLVIELLRHWKVDRDNLYEQGKWKAFMYSEGW